MSIARVFASLFVALLAATFASAAETSISGDWKLALRAPGSTEAGPAHTAVHITQIGKGVTGRMAPFMLEGSRDGDSVDLAVSVNDRGKRALVGFFALTVGEDGSLKGSGFSRADGSAIADASRKALAAARAASPGTYEVFDVIASRTAPPPPGCDISCVLQGVCNGIGSIASFVIGAVSDNAFRPMGECWFEKVGGGFYVFGHHAPGSLMPAWTQTFYQPIEVAACTKRQYGFTLSYDGQIFGGEGINYIINTDLQQYATTFDELGFTTAAEATAAIQQFYAAVGDFAILIGWSVETGSLNPYIILSDNSKIQTALNQPLVQRFLGHLHVNIAPNAVGRVVNDTYTQRRSIVTCGNGVVFAYIIGTAKVDIE